MSHIILKVKSKGFVHYDDLVNFANTQTSSLMSSCLSMSVIYNIEGASHQRIIMKGAFYLADSIGIAPAVLRGKMMFSIEQQKKVCESARPNDKVGMATWFMGWQGRDCVLRKLHQP
mmetsp:Transcript_17084/g.49344  ORF Transcript_17084/g.49344 Transcript_17084/m.49344 type:complete len:117 (+) Transcript_17084:522-872(+)